MSPNAVHLWVRHEERETERRAPIVPDDARRLVEQGVLVSVEDGPQRVFPIADYAAAGCRIVPDNSWVDAPADAYVLGIKELPDEPQSLRHRHIFFGHAFKQQPGAQALLKRFVAGGGQLLDLEYLVDDGGHRLAAFGYWAGYVGAALAVLQARGRLGVPLVPTTRAELDAQLAAPGPAPRCLVVGALGRSGRGAVAALERAGLAPTRWDIRHTRQLDHAALLGHDLLVNCVLSRRPVDPFVRPQDVAGPRQLQLISDVTCDVGSPTNVLPIYDEVTSWAAPVRRLSDGDPPGRPPLDIIAIDNLPSLLPAEASTAFSAELSAVLPALGEQGTPGAQAWARCRQVFSEHRP